MQLALYSLSLEKYDQAIKKDYIMINYYHLKIRRNSSGLGTYLRKCKSDNLLKNAFFFRLSVYGL